MRTTLNIDDDLLLAVKEIARRESKSGSCPGAWCKSVALYAAPGG